MSDITPVGYLVILAGAALLSLVLVPLALRVALRLGALDHPGGHKQQPSAVPHLGGVAMVVAFAVAVLVAALVRPPVAGLAQLATILGLAVAVSLVGLVDDLWGLSPWLRLVVVGAAAGGLWAAGVGTNLFGGGVLDLAVTVLWVVGVTNAINLLDNMDGLSAGVAAIAAVFFWLIAVLHGQFLVAALSLALVGCAMGFLRHNFHPARIYMGDAGSLCLGFLLAVLGVKLEVPTDPVIAAFVPILVLGLAIFDTALVTVTRITRGVSPFEGGRDHASHRLVALGVPVPLAVGLLYLAATGLGWLGVIMARLQDLLTAYLLLGFTIVSLAGAGGLLALVRLAGDTSRATTLSSGWSDLADSPGTGPGNTRG